MIRDRGNRPQRSIHLRLAVAAGALAALAPAATASPTQFFHLRRAADYRDAELIGASVSSNGALRAGVSVEPIELPDATVSWALVDFGAGALAGSGPEGVVFRVDGGAARAESTGTGQVLALARGADGSLYAGTGPDGRILRRRGERWEPFAETGAKYVWALAWSGRSLYAAVGPDGHLLRIDDRGRVSTVFRAPSGPLTALAPDGRGGVFAAGSGRGSIFWHQAGRTRAIYQTAEQEVRSLVYQRGVLYAAAMTVSPVTVETQPREGGEDGAAVRPASASEAGAAVYRIVPDSTASVLWRSPQGLVFAIAPRAEGGLWVATGSRAALYALDERGRAESLYQAGEGQVTAIAPHPDGGAWMATSNPARLYRVRRPATNAEARAGVLDAGRFARWGRFVATGDLTGAEFATRGGTTATPDSTWSDWQGVAHDGDVASPPARYLQWRARLRGNAEVREVRIAYAERNQPPRIEDFSAAPEPGRYYAGEISPRQDPVTQMLPGGQRLQYSAPGPAPGPLDLLPNWARGLRPLQWRASDPNNDPLLYRIEARPRAAADWIVLADAIAAPPFTWDTNGFAEGEYELRLTASDRSRQGEEELTDEETIASIVVDHTAPRLEALRVTADGRDVITEGEASDGGLYVSKVEVMVGDGQWVLATPLDGVWDEPRERFRARVSGVTPATHAVRVRAADAVGNATVQVDRVRVSP